MVKKTPSHDMIYRITHSEGIDTMFGHSPKLTPLIEEVIYEASQVFIPGEQNTNKLLFKKNSKLRPGSRSYPDPNFRVDANALPETNLIASIGPQYTDMHNFILDTALNETKPVERIVALCDPTTVYTHETTGTFFDGDSFDYFLTPREFKIADYTCTLKRLSGSTSLDESKNEPLGLVEAELEIKNENLTKKIRVTFFEVIDGLGITLNNETYKQASWDLSVHSQTQPLLVHCRSGIGRTGSFVLMLEILKNYDTIFESQNAKTIADTIMGILARLRTVRPALVLMREQLAIAIRNAYVLHQFALEKGYKEKPGSEAKASQKRSAPVEQQEDKLENEKEADKSEDTEKDHSTNLSKKTKLKK